VRHYYLATALPALGELGSHPPLRLDELAERLAGTSAAPLAEAILLEEDLIQREACLAGELAEPRPVVLTADQVRGRAALPSPLGDGPEASTAAGGDALWAAYWHHVAAVAEARRSAFLAAWVGAEVALRNTLAAARARALGLDASRYLVAPDLGAPRPREDDLVARWAAAPNPLAGLQLILRSRWAWLAENEPWFSFSDDELAAYTARLALLHRWYRAAHVRDHDHAPDRERVRRHGAAREHGGREGRGA
jgi:hypothetical protein